jgi:hypothetical protein
LNPKYIFIEENEHLKPEDEEIADLGKAKLGSRHQTCISIKESKVIKVKFFLNLYSSDKLARPVQLIRKLKVHHKLEFEHILIFFLRES